VAKGGSLVLKVVASGAGKLSTGGKKKEWGLGKLRTKQARYTVSESSEGEYTFRVDVERAVRLRVQMQR